MRAYAENEVMFSVRPRVYQTKNPRPGGDRTRAFNGVSTYSRGAFTVSDAPPRVRHLHRRYARLGPSLGSLAGRVARHSSRARIAASSAPSHAPRFSKYRKNVPGEKYRGMGGSPKSHASTSRAKSRARSPTGSCRCRCANRYRLKLIAVFFRLGRPRRAIPRSRFGLVGYRTAEPPLAHMWNKSIKHRKGNSCQLLTDF